MIKKLLAMVAVAAAALTFIPPEPAEAQRGYRGGGGFRGGAVRVRPVVRPRPAFRGPVIVRRPVYVRRPVRVVRPFYVAPVVAVVGHCEWLRRRAVVTVSPYWWRRYNRCRGYW